MNEVDERIRKARAAIAERDHMRNVTGQLATEIEAESKRVTELGATLTDEQKDVRRYERGVWAFLYGLFADREKRLTKEQQEAALAEMKYREAVATRDELLSQSTELAQRIAALENAERDLEAARADKRAKLAGTATGTELDGLAGQIGSADAELKNLDEAIAAGERAKAALLQLSEVLGSARNWGTADIFMDSMFVSWAKREKLDNARSLAGVAQADLTLFQRELADVGVALEAAAISAADKGRFLDVWFDNIFSDLAVQDRIEEAQRTCGNALGEVSLRLTQTQQRRAALGQKIADLVATHNTILDPK